MTGHIVGVDPMTGLVVVLRKGQDGKASRQVDVLTEREASNLCSMLNRAVLTKMSARDGLPVANPVGQIAAAPEPEQTAFDLDSLTEGNHTA